MSEEQKAALKAESAAHLQELADMIVTAQRTPIGEFDNWQNGAIKELQAVEMCLRLLHREDQSPA